MVPIPGPTPLPFIGNMKEVDRGNIIHGFCLLADTYGPIYKLHFGREEKIIITNQKLVNEVCSRILFKKYPLGFLKDLRAAIPDGLFTAYPGQESWGIAHRILLPALSPVAVQSMLPEMVDITSQLILKWARFGSTNKINAPEDFTRLTFDIIALCGMDTRLNSFYQEKPPPIAVASVELLAETQLRASRPSWYTACLWQANQRFEENNRLLHEVAKQVVENRRKDPKKKKDLVDALLNGKDTLTGKGLDDGAIIDNMITFLIAGHETASGLLSFLFVLLLKHPEIFSKLKAEVDTVLGRGPITASHLSKLSYTKACIRETLRLHPTAPIWTVTPVVDNPAIPVLLDGQWEIKHGQVILIVNPKLHRDPAVWGDDADEFQPERMLEENFRKLPKNCWKPWGNGSRACIGGDFATQEVMIAAAVIIQNFDLQLVDPEYQLSVREALTIKPRDFFIYAKLRPHIDLLSLQADLLRAKNAQGFVKWLSGTKTNQLEGVKFALFGCGNSNWQGTFQQIPTLLFELMKKHGAIALAPQVGVDVSGGDAVTAFQTWQADHLWPGLSQVGKGSSGGSIVVSSDLCVY
ncbi:cytochrome P450 [Xylariaceae sp. FL0255]|nr:cytochrome P450 [Xylariaceae sp. FL0255]